LFVIIGITLLTVLALRSNGTTATNVFFYLGTIGVLSMLIAYVTVNLGALKFPKLARQIGSGLAETVGTAEAATEGE
jgi:hypothetical protein